MTPLALSQSRLSYMKVNCNNITYVLGSRMTRLIDYCLFIDIVRMLLID